MTQGLAPQPITREHARLIPWPSENTHKHTRGRLAVVAGDELHTGAARLVAHAGQRIGAGWVSVFGDEAACRVMAHHETSILVCKRDLAATLGDQLSHFDTIVIGPALGLTTAAHADVEALIEAYTGILVLDADALTHIGAKYQPLYRAANARTAPTILTPHSGEFSALFGVFDPADKVEGTLKAASHSNCVIVHKGSETVLASPDGCVFVAHSGAPFLATAGTGDVLAGMIGGLCAQGMQAMDACKAAIWLHGEAGRKIGAGLIAEDIVAALPALLGELFLGNS